MRMNGYWADRCKQQLKDKHCRELPKKEMQAFNSPKSMKKVLI